MAFLMLLHEKMRLQRKQNKLTLKQLRYNHLVERKQKQVSNREKYYSKLEKQIDTQANVYKNMGQNFINNKFGTGLNSWNPNTLFSTATVGLNQNIYAWILETATKQGVDPELVHLYINQGQLGFNQVTDPKNNNQVTGYQYNGGTIDAAKFKIITDIANQSKIISAQCSQVATQWNNEYTNNISIWAQAQKDALDAQKEWEMDLLAEEQGDLEAEKDSIDAQIQLIDEQKKNIEQRLGQAIQDSAPKFGLG